MKLTASNAKTLAVPPGKSEAVFFDDDVSGFGVRVKSSGARSYVMCWKVKGAAGKFEHRRVTIGSVGDTDFSKAKDRAKDIKANVRLGADPANEIKTAKLDAAQTFEATARPFLNAVRTNYRPRTFYDLERHLTIYAAPLAKKPVARITRHDVAAVLQTVTEENGAVTANRVRSSLSIFFSWSMQRAHVDANPVTGTEKHSEQSRARVLAPSELRLIWNALGDDDYGRIVKLLLLTGQREKEIGSLSRAEIAEALIVLPPERTKNHRPHTVPLAPAAVAIIEQQEQQREPDQQFLFGRGEGGFAGWSKCKERLDERITKSHGGKPMAHWTLHDLRRSFATYIQGGLEPHHQAKLAKSDRELAHGLGILPHVVEAILNHVSGSKAGVAGIYNRSTYEREKRQALDLWADRVQAIIEGKPSNVTPLRREA